MECKCVEIIESAIIETEPKAVVQKFSNAVGRKGFLHCKNLKIVHTLDGGLITSIPQII
jgi:hypothetical protein